MVEDVLGRWDRIFSVATIFHRGEPGGVEVRVSGSFYQLIVWLKACVGSLRTDRVSLGDWEVPAGGNGKGSGIGLHDFMAWMIAEETGRWWCGRIAEVLSSKVP